MRTLNQDFTVRNLQLFKPKCMGNPSFSLCNAQSEVVLKLCDLSSLHGIVCIIKSRMIFWYTCEEWEI